MTATSTPPAGPKVGAGDGVSHARPIFVVGAQRSGTTMLRLMLNAHPRIAIPYESDFIPKLYRRIPEFGDLSSSANIEKLLDAIAADPFVKNGNLIPDRARVLDQGPATYAELIDAIYSNYASHEGKARWGDKDPDYVTELDTLVNLFPTCQIVHIVRDGRAVATSLRRLDWGSKNLLKLAQDWSWRVTLGHKMGMMLPRQQYLELRYEDLVRAPEAVLRRTCEYLGEPFSPEMLRYPERAAADFPRPALKYHQRSVQAPDPTMADKWHQEMSATDRILFDEIAGRTLAQFGYARETRRSRARSIVGRLRYTVVDRW